MNTSVFDDVLGHTSNKKGKKAAATMTNKRSYNPFAPSFDDDDESMGYENMSNDSAFFSSDLSADFRGKPNKGGRGNKVARTFFFGRARKSNNDPDKVVKIASRQDSDEEIADSENDRQGRRSDKVPQKDNGTDESKDSGRHPHWDSSCGKLFFIWLFLTATIYGSIAVVSSLLLLLAFPYTRWFESERERDLFQLACLGFAIMFCLILTSMWISYKEQQYGWAFVASLPSLAIFAAVVIILQTGDIGPSSTAAYMNDDYGYDGMDAYDQGYDPNAYDQGYDPNANGGY